MVYRLIKPENIKKLLALMLCFILMIQFSQSQNKVKNLPAYLGLEEILPVEDWRILHCQYSPNGKKISFRLDAGRLERLRLLGLCNIDGSDFKIQNKALHFMWYDNESIIGHIRYGEHGEYLPPEKKWLLRRWSPNGKYIETMGPGENNLALSPIRDCFVSETLYHTIPVIVTLIPKEQKDKTVEIARFDPYDLTWNRWFHVNPAFSRDGNRIYYSKPLNEKYNGTFVCELKYK